MEALQTKQAMTEEEIHQAQQQLGQQQTESQEELAALLALLLLLAIQAGFTAAAAALILPALVFPREQVERFVGSYSEKLARQVMRTTGKEIAEVIRTAQAEGWAETKLRDEVRAVLNRAAKERAPKIGLTEAVRMTNIGALFAYQQAGFQFKRWAAVGDSRTCAFCMALDGTIIPVAEPFARVGDVIAGPDGKELKVTYMDVISPPLHPNCRCVLLPANAPIS